MLLAINISNNEIKLGGFLDGKLIFTSAISNSKYRTSHETAIIIKNVLDLYTIEKTIIKSSIISSVAPFSTDIVMEAVFILTGVKSILVGPGIKTGLNIGTDNPAEVGSEIVTASVSAIKKYGEPLIIIIFGTATTFAVIDKNKKLIGTVIAPGINLSLSALCKKTALLPQTSIKKPKKIVGTNSIESIESGTYYGTISMIDGITGLIEKELGQQAKIVATGDIGYIFCKRRDKKIIFDKNLVLDGLEMIYNKNM